MAEILSNIFMKSNVKFELAKKWLHDSGEKTAVHALRRIEAGLSELVDSLLLEGKAPYYISKVLQDRMIGHHYEWQIPSRKSIKTYRDKYFYNSTFFLQNFIQTVPELRRRFLSFNKFQA